MERKYGVKMAEVIKNRMAFLEAADNLELVPQHKPYRRHKLRGEWKGHFAIDLIHPFRLIFRNQTPPSSKNDEEIDLKKITEIEIIGIIDYH